MEFNQDKKRSFVKVDKDIRHYIPCLYARAVFINLCEHRNSVTGLCCPNEIDIAKEELMSVWKVKKCIKLLASLKIITITKQWKSNGYLIHDKDISYLSGVCDTLDTSLSGVCDTLDTSLSGVCDTLDQVCDTTPNNINSKKMNKNNNKMNKEKEKEKEKCVFNVFNKNELDISHKEFGHHDGSHLAYTILSGYWKEVFNIVDDYGFNDPKRNRLVTDALRCYGLSKCKEAIKGCSLSKFHVDNDFISMATIFKDNETIAKHIRRKKYESINKSKESKNIRSFEVYGKFYEGKKNESK